MGDKMVHYHVRTEPLASIKDAVDMLKKMEEADTETIFEIIMSSDDDNSETVLQA